MKRNLVTIIPRREPNRQEVRAVASDTRRVIRIVNRVRNLVRVNPNPHTPIPSYDPNETDTPVEETPVKTDIPVSQRLESLPGLQLPNKKFNEYALIASVARASFYQFVKQFWHVISAERPVWNWHIKYICDHVQNMCERIFAGLPKEYDTIINIPPGTTKSTILSVMLPIWCWTRMPSFRFIGASYSFQLQQDLSRKARDIVESDKFKLCFPTISMREDQNTKGYFLNTQGGFRYAVGINGTVTGMHAHLIVVDDPINPLEATSAAELKTANYWLEHQLSNRKVDKKVASMILVMQRICQGDPTDLFLLRKKKFHIKLPAELVDGPLPEGIRKFYVDGLLDPVRLDSDVLDEEKQKGQYYYAAQFRQEPVPAGGAMFKADKINEGMLAPTRWAKRVRYWDKAGTEGDGMFTVGVLMGKDMEGRYWVLDVIRGQWDSGKRERIIRETAKRDGRNVVIGIEQEPGSGGKESAQSSVRRLAGYSVRLDKVGKSDGDKVQRADPYSVQVNNGNVYLANDGDYHNGWKRSHGIDVHWNKEYLDELKFFPFSKFKDQVDASSGAFNVLTKRRVIAGGMF